MFDGKLKAITFSYDDGVSQDIRLIELFNKYGMKGTFNLNSCLLGREATLLREGKEIPFIKVKPEDVRHIYDGHEVAVHTLTHPNLVNIEDDNEVLRQVEEDRIKLSELCGYEVRGMAYPSGGKNCDDRVAKIIRENTPIKYARTVPVSKSFEPYPDNYQYKGTLYHHDNWDELFSMGEKFLSLKTETPKVFYIWGHAFEFDIYPERWGIFEEFLQMMSGKKDIFYGTNLEILG